MILWRQLPAWALRAWPALALLPFFALHACALVQFSEKTMIVNKLAGMSLQVLGGLLILYSVNENLGLFRKQSLSSAFMTWLREFPVSRKSVVVAATGSAIASSGGTASVSTVRAPSTLEERVANLESMLSEVRSQVRNEFNAIRSQIDAARLELTSRIDVTTGRVAQLYQQIERVAVGGFKLQAFGVLLAVYGAVTSVFA